MPVKEILKSIVIFPTVFRHSPLPDELKHFISKLAAYLDKIKEGEAVLLAEYLLTIGSQHPKQCTQAVWALFLPTQSLPLSGKLLESNHDMSCCGAALDELTSGLNSLLQNLKKTGKETITQYFHE